MPTIGKIEYFLINDGIMLMDGGGAFGLVPKAAWKKRIAPDEHNQIPMNLLSLLIRSGDKTILVDTGMGQKFNEQTQQRLNLKRPTGDLVSGLARLGLKVEDIDIVINTHLHMDHCGGNTRLIRGRPIPTFPNAEYIIQRLEWADAIMPNERTRATYHPENYQPLQESGQLKIINGDTRITPEVRTAIARGHTRAHQVVIIESEGETALFVADMTTLHYHFERLAWVTSYDVEPLESIETKRYWQRWAVERDALIIFQHDSQMVAGKLHPDGKRYKVEPVEIEI